MWLANHVVIELEFQKWQINFSLYWIAFVFHCYFWNSFLNDASVGNSISLPNVHIAQEFSTCVMTDFVLTCNCEGTVSFSLSSTTPTNVQRMIIICLTSFPRFFSFFLFFLGSLVQLTVWYCEKPTDGRTSFTLKVSVEEHTLPSNMSWIDLTHADLGGGSGVFP